MKKKHYNTFIWLIVNFLAFESLSWHHFRMMTILFLFRYLKEHLLCGVKLSAGRSLLYPSLSSENPLVTSLYGPFWPTK